MLQKGTEMTHLAETHSICQVQPDHRHQRDAHPQQAVQSVRHQCQNNSLQQSKHDVEDTGVMEPHALFVTTLMPSTTWWGRA